MKKHRFIKIFGCIILLLVIVVLLFLFNNYPTRQEIDFSPNQLSSEWMKDLDGDKLISEFSIPGSHDSGAIRKGGIYNLGHDQNLFINRQLKVGVRFFDLRLGLKDDELMIYHGFLNEKVYFKDILKDFRYFLEENPTETILMCIKKEHGDDIGESLHQVLDGLGNLLYKNNTIPKLNDVRGKIVLVRRFEDNQEYGINLYDGFQDSTTFDINGDYSIHVQDYYYLEDKSYLDTKWNEIKNCLIYSTTSSANTLVINFTSAYIPIIKGTPTPLIKVVSDYIHPLIKEYLSNNSKGNYGIVLFDYVDEELSSIIYNSNFVS